MPNSSRRTTDVLRELLDEMDNYVVNYHPDISHTGRNLGQLIQGTSFFPGGAGVWRGAQNGGPLPAYFPIAPVMFVAHNFDSEVGYAQKLAKHGEVEGPFWRHRLLPVLAASGLDPADAFFTNVLMGLKPGSATGKMPIVPGYEEQCVRFFKRQCEIVRPSVIVTVGGDASKILHRYVPKANMIMHWSAREYSPLATRSAVVEQQGRILAEIISRNANKFSS